MRNVTVEMEFTRYCPETGDALDILVTLHGTWLPSEPGSFYDPPAPAGVCDVRAEANGRDFPLSRREVDWASEFLSDTLD